MPDESVTQPSTVDVVVDLPPPVDGVKKPMPVDPTIEKILDQAIAKTHEVWLSQIQREDQGMGAFAELMRQSFGAAGVGQTHLAAGILSQRSVQAQPQQQPGPGGTGVPFGMKLVPL